MIFILILAAIFKNYAHSNLHECIIDRCTPKLNKYEITWPENMIEVMSSLA